MRIKILIIKKVIILKLTLKQSEKYNKTAIWNLKKDQIIQWISLII